MRRPPPPPIAYPRLECNLCYQQLPDEDFSINLKATNRRHRQAHCKACYRVYLRDHRQWKRSHA